MVLSSAVFAGVLAATSSEPARAAFSDALCPEASQYVNALGALHAAPPLGNAAGGASPQAVYDAVHATTSAYDTCAKRHLGDANVEPGVHYAYTREAAFSILEARRAARARARARRARCRAERPPFGAGRRGLAAVDPAIRLRHRVERQRQPAVVLSRLRADIVKAADAFLAALPGASPVPRPPRTGNRPARTGRPQPMARVRRKSGARMRWNLEIAGMAALAFALLLGIALVAPPGRTGVVGTGVAFALHALFGVAAALFAVLIALVGAIVFLEINVPRMIATLGGAACAYFVALDRGHRRVRTRRRRAGHAVAGALRALARRRGNVDRARARRRRGHGRHHRREVKKVIGWCITRLAALRPPKAAPGPPGAALALRPASLREAFHLPALLPRAPQPVAAAAAAGVAAPRSPRRAHRRRTGALLRRDPDDDDVEDEDDVDDDDALDDALATMKATTTTTTRTRTTRSRTSRTTKAPTTSSPACRMPRAAPSR